MDDLELIARVERLPAIWSPRARLRGSDASAVDVRRNRAAWRLMCQAEYGGFDQMPPNEKRDKCLLLQKRWLGLRQAYCRAVRGGRRRSATTSASASASGQTPKLEPELIAKMAFLADTVSDNESSAPPSPTDAAEDSAPSAAKRHRSDSAASGSASLTSTPTPPDVSLDEDRHFLLSLVSYMQDVPRRDRLALRRDMLELIAKYAKPTASSN